EGDDRGDDGQAERAAELGLTLSRAEAMPLRSAGTPDMAATEVGMSTSPAPRPTMTSGTIRLVSSCPDTGSRASRNIPPSATSDPAAVVNRTPIRDTTAGPAPAETRMDRPSGM